MRTLLATICVILAVTSAAPARAERRAQGSAEFESRCDAHELLANRSAVKRALRCEGAAAWGRRASCRPIENECVSDMTDELAELLIGPSSRPTVCQVETLRHAAKYVDRRLRERARGKRASRRALRLVSKIESACSGVVADEDSPAFGGACSELLVAGDPVPAEALAHCLRASIERVIDDAAPERLRPNIVLIVTDDQRVETLEYMPHLNRLADQGVRFTNGFVTTALCSPSRASIFSGQYVHNHGSTTNFGEFDDSDTLAPWMSEAGYATGFFGKYRNNTVRGSHVPPGWDEWQAFNDPPGLPPRCPGGGNCFTDYWLSENGELVFYGDDEESYPTDLLADRVLDFIDDHSDVPFLAVYAPPAPHAPSTPAARHAGQFADLAPWRPPSWNVAAPLQPAWVRFFQFHYTEEVAAIVDQRRIDQIESLQSVDEAVGHIVDELERRGLRDNTFILYTSDHGIHWGEHGWHAKRTPYEEAIRVPYVVSYPSRAPIAQQHSAMVLNIDVAPTIAGLAGATLGPVDGESIIPLLEDGAEGRGSFLIENLVDFLVDPSTAVRTPRWKYIETDAQSGADRELYDLESDPDELHNLAFDPAYQNERLLLSLRLAELRAQ